MEPAMEIFGGGRGRGCYCRASGDGQRLVGFTSEQLVSEGEIWIKENAHMGTHTVGCSGIHWHAAHAHKCTNLSKSSYGNTHMAANKHVHKDTQPHTNFKLTSPYRSYSLLFHHLSFAFTVYHPSSQNPSLCCFFFFLQGLCFPLPTVMLISAVIRREGLNAAFLTNPLRQTHRAEQSRTERRAHAF